MEQKKVTIIDYNLGNLYSVRQACDVVGINAVVSSNVSHVENADALILPGVGAFIEAMTNLESLGLTNAILEAAAQKRPLFGICLGLQLLFSASEEFGAGKGLGLIPGMVKKFQSGDDRTHKMRVPQIGWNTISQVLIEWGQTPLRGIKNQEHMYFVHSYFVSPENDDCILSKTVYDGTEYCSSVICENIFATQFHPEKSAEKGLSIYKNWALINNLI